MQLLSADATIFSKVEKNTLKSCSEKLKSTFFPLLPELPKQPKQKNSCSKKWLIDQLYIELGSALYVFHTHLMFFSFYIRNLKLSIDFFKKAADFSYEFLNGQDFLL